MGSEFQSDTQEDWKYRNMAFQASLTSDVVDVQSYVFVFAFFYSSRKKSQLMMITLIVTILSSYHMPGNFFLVHITIKK